MADFRREYHVPEAELRAMGLDEFMRLLQGLSSRARFPEAWEKSPKHLYDRSDIDAIRAKALR